MQPKGPGGVRREELVRSYATRPQLAAKKAADHQLRALAAMHAGALDDAVAHWDRADEYHDVLDALVRCRRCGRELTHPASVAVRIGPECAAKTGVGGCPFCGGTGQMAFPDPVLGGYSDHDCWCQNRPRVENIGTSGEVLPMDPPAAGTS